MSEPPDELEAFSDLSTGFDFSAGLSDFSDDFSDDFSEEEPDDSLLEPLIVLFGESRLSLR